MEKRVNPMNSSTTGRPYHVFTIRQNLVVVGFIILWLANPSTCLGGELPRQMANDSQIMDRLASKEDSLLQVVESNEDPEGNGKVYFEIARMYAGQMGRKFVGVGGVAAAKTITYCQKALEYPLETWEAAQVCVYWGDALSITAQRTVGTTVGPRALAAPYFKGLRIIASARTQEKEEILPPVNLYDMGGGNNAAARWAAEKRARQLAARNEVALQNKLIHLRDGLIRKCAEIYVKLPDGDVEMNSDADDAMVGTEDQKEILKLMADGNLPRGARGEPIP
jgi:hypothetical protein